jgi:hypothetical protein
MPELSYRSNQIKLNYPSKVLAGSLTNQTGESYWDHANGSDDPWYSGAFTKKFYRWEVTFTVTEANHGSHLTRESKKYNGLDVVVGDWLGGAASGQCVKIVSISNKTKGSVTAIVEDVLRYNTFSSATGNGMFNNGGCVIFSLNEDGLPLLDPLPSVASLSFYPTVMSRFGYLNPQLNYILHQDAHGLQTGDVVSVISTGFVKANTATMDRMIGTVTDAGPGPNQFIISPNNRIIDFDPKIPGNQGDYIYIQDDGSLGTSDTGKAAFLNIQNAIPTVLDGTVDGPEVPVGHVIELNGQTVTFSGASANANVSEIASSINSSLGSHFVTASTITVSTNATSDTSATAYGLVGGYVNFSAYFDSGSGNTLVNFTTDTAGQSAYGIAVALAEDMAADINAANITNLTAGFTASNLLTLTEASGNSITITNNTNDNNNKPFVGTSNVSGMPAIVTAPGTEKLKLTRSDGGEILIYENTEYFRVGTGIASGHTGQYPLAMNIEQGLRTAGTSVVSDISARDSLTAEAGDGAYVLNKGDGEWGMYVYSGSAWVMTSNEDSATTDAKTLTTTFTMPAGGFGTATTQLMGNVSPGRRLLNVSVDVTTAFTGYSGSIPNIQVGTLADPDAFVPSTSNAMDEAGSFEATPDFIHPSSETQDLEVRARCTHNGATAGNVTVKLTYV